MVRRNLKRWQPLRKLVGLRDDMDRLFSSFFGRTPEALKGQWSPVVDIEKDHENFMVQAEIPGIEKENMKIPGRGNILLISGEREQESEIRSKTFHLIERTYGKFSGPISLPADVDADNVRATYQDGIRTVTLPKPETMKPREIGVEIN